MDLAFEFLFGLSCLIVVWAIYRDTEAPAHRRERFLAALVILLAARMVVRFYTRGAETTTVTGLAVSLLALVCLAVSATAGRLSRR